MSNTTFIVSTFIIFFIPLLWLFFVFMKDTNMHKNIKLGDPVYFYIEDIKYKGTFVRKKEDGTFVIRYGIGLHYINEIHPVLNYKYKQ